MGWKIILVLLSLLLMLTACSEVEIIEEKAEIVNEDMQEVPEYNNPNIGEEPLDAFDPNADIQGMGVMVDSSNNNPDEYNQIQFEESSEQKYSISEAELLYTGGFADPTIVKLEDGTWLMYLHHFDDSIDSMLDVTRGSYAYSSTDALNWELMSESKAFGVGAPRAFNFGDVVRVFHGWHPNDADQNSESEFGDLDSSLIVNGVDADYEGLAVSARDGYSIISASVIEIDTGYQMYFDEESSANEEVGSGEIWSAYSEDGLVWERESTATIVYSDLEAKATKVEDIFQILKPKVLYWEAQGQYVMFYNSHSEIFLATSSDGVSWEKEGYIGIHGADVEAIENEDGTLRLYYGDWSSETSGVVYTVIFDYLES
ncbi:hypothetical protein HOA92_06520 [archaeon]|jgi:hypothetical protein|nr:hypothetical protein [archaeon]MBT6762665.1 hypothetical protein [archaeon]